MAVNLYYILLFLVTAVLLGSVIKSLEKPKKIIKKDSKEKELLLEKLTLVDETKAVEPEEAPYFSRKAISKVEMILYGRLVEAFPHLLILPQVGLSRFLGVKSSYNFGIYFNRINRMSVDFLICNEDAKVLAAIELDDSSHDRADRQQADTKKNSALASAGIRLIRWHVKKIPQVHEIRAAFAESEMWDAEPSGDIKI